MFWFESIWIWYNENTAKIFREDTNFRRYYTGYITKNKTTKDQFINPIVKIRCCNAAGKAQREKEKKTILLQ